MIFRSAWAVALVLIPSVTLAGPVTFIERAPADPAAISVAVDQAQLHDTLPFADLTDLIEAGRLLFAARFTGADGAGRPRATQAIIPTHFKHAREMTFQRASGPDANSCTSCHLDPIAGGAGDFTTNVFTSEGTESADFDTVDAQFSNERGTNHLFGSGLVELLAREMTVDLQTLRDDAVRAARRTLEPVTVTLESKGINFGTLTAAPDGLLDLSSVAGVDIDLKVRPFSQKGVFPSLRMFTINALNAHHGMGADERFGAAMTGEADFDGDGFADEFSPGLVSALVAYQASLEPPLQTPFENAEWQAAAEAGEAAFTATGCAACHVPSLPLSSLSFADPGPLDTAGTLSVADVAMPAIYDLGLLEWAKSLPRNADGDVMVPLFGDLKRHVIADNQNPHFANELMGQSFVARDAFMTSELWGVADTAPFGHRGDLMTLDEVILAHGGEAVDARDIYAALPRQDRDNLITFLKTLRMPQ